MINNSTVLLEFDNEKILMNTETYNYVIGSDLFDYLANLNDWTNCAHLIDNLPNVLIQKVFELFQTLVDCEILLVGGETDVR